MTRRQSSLAFIVAGLLVAVLLGVVVAPHASSQPDGLERVAADHGLDSEVRQSAAAGGPLSDYQVDSIDDRSLSTGVAAIVGIALTFVATLGLMRVARTRRTPPRIEHR